MSFSLANRFALSLLVSASGIATAQQYIEPFTNSPGTLIPGYTEVSGDWQSTGSAVQCQQGMSRQILIHDTITDLDGCIEAIVEYDTANPGQQHGGVMFRMENTGASPTFYHLSLLDPFPPYTGWSHWELRYDGYPLTILSGGFLGVTTRARVRLHVSEHPSGVRVQAQIDKDLDGRLDVNDSRVTQYGLGSGVGSIGLFGGNGARFDDLKWYDAALYYSGIASVGSSLPLMGRGSPGFGYLGFCSLGNTGFPIGGGRRVPLDPDGLFGVSLSDPLTFQNFAGITDPAGNFTMMLHIPPIPQLAGLSIWCSAVTFQGTTVAEIAPDVQIILQ